MNRPRRRNSVAVALWANAFLLAGILIYLLARGNVSVTSNAYGQPQAPIAGGGGIFIMPGQLAQNNWGCWLVDIDHQTLAAYEYSPGSKKLNFAAARYYRYDVQLKDWGTGPSWRQVQALIEKENAGGRQAPVAPDKVNPEVQPGEPKP